MSDQRWLGVRRADGDTVEAAARACDEAIVGDDTNQTLVVLSVS
jgi:hypothetical protein